MNQRPNVLWITTDHQVYANHYFFQPAYRGKLKTLERLAAEGRRYNQAYTVCPLCTPARASMLTGTYPHNHGLILNPEMLKDTPPTPETATRMDFDRNDELFGDCLKHAGYRIAQIGKWYGGRKTAEQFGFDGWSLPWYGAPLRTDEYRDYLVRNRLPDPIVKVLWSADEPEAVGREFNLTHPLKYAFGPHHAARRLLSPKETHEAYFVADMAVNWLEDYADAGNTQPFMLKVDVWGPHHPYDPAEPFAGSIPPESVLEYPSFSEAYDGKPSNYASHKLRWQAMADMDWEDMRSVVAASYEHAIMVDDAMGLILDKLEQLSLDNNTIVIMTADHGDIVGAHGNLFNKETLMVEETMKIPMVIRYPEHIGAGEVSENLVTNMDVPPTIMAAAGAVPAYKPDGIDILGEATREHLMCETFGCYKREFPQRMLRWKNYKYIAHYNDSDELYDLTNDPYELHNLITDSKHKEVLSEMQAKLKGEIKQTGDMKEEAKEIFDRL